ncbi:hypothetical protein DL95DRAFT_165882 [Leptodontidium sp. 2 PMI_412]|nr:hypothetical protein DL95DRAFT_165882 [Leptodontidium sp. 2 PMI_412]
MRTAIRYQNNQDCLIKAITVSPARGRRSPAVCTFFNEISPPQQQVSTYFSASFSFPATTDSLSFLLPLLSSNN